VSRRRSHSIRRKPAQRERPPAVAADKVGPPEDNRRQGWFLVLGFVAIALAAVALYYLGGVSRWGPPEPEALDPPSTVPDSPEQQLCRQFMALKNAGDPRAADLLGPAPTVPAAPVSAEEADRLEAEFILRRDYQVVKVRPDTSGGSHTPPRVVLVLHGAVDTERIPVATPTGPEVRFRSLAHPDIIVEVKDNKILGVRAQLQEDPNEKKMSPETLERLQRMLSH
jgi:hypothetical protein